MVSRYFLPELRYAGFQKYRYNISKQQQITTTRNNIISQDGATRELLEPKCKFNDVLKNIFLIIVHTDTLF